MKNWGVVVTVVYGLVVLGVILPVSMSGLLSVADMTGMVRDHVVWVWLALLVACQALLLFLRVDTSARRPARRRHIVVSALTVGCAVGLLTSAACLALMVAWYGEDDANPVVTVMTDNTIGVLATLAASWLLWSVLFFRRFANATSPVDAAVRWLMKGSVLELLIVVPCHVIVRRRGDCSAPVETGFGIATGLAVMLLAFGPSILFLVAERWHHYHAHRPSVGDAT